MQAVSKVKSGGAAIWKVAIFAAAAGPSNGEYVWDGVTVNNGKRLYQTALNPMYWDGSQWVLEDTIFEDITYKSADLITWERVNGGLPVPSSALSYSQSSYIQTIVLASGNPDQSGTYTWDGTTFINGKPKYMGPLKSGAPENNYIYWNTEEYSLYGWNADEMANCSVSIDLASNWEPSDAAGPPVVSSIVYTV